METPDSSPPYTPPEPTPFERWLEPARPKAKYWRTVVGFFIVILVWMAWSAFVIGLAVFQHMMGGAEASPESVEAAMNSIIAGATPTDVIAIMSSFWGLWFGVWVAARTCHDRTLKSVIAPPGGFRWTGVLFGMLIIAVYIGLGFALTFLLGGVAPYRSALSINDWAIWLIPFLVLIFLQSSGEEVFFRGYLIQNLGARTRNAFIWGFIPAVIFGIGHYANVSDPVFAAYYVVATVLFALIATAVVWRTGGLAVAMGMHAANNFFAFLVIGPDESMSSTQLWLVSTETVIKGAPFDLISLVLLLVYVLSPLAPFPGEPMIGRRKVTRAAP